MKTSAIPQIQSFGTLAASGQPQSVAPAVPAVTRSPAAERMKLHRERKKNGMRCATIELRETEIDALIKLKLLKAEMRDDREAIAEALYGWFERELD